MEKTGRFIEPKVSIKTPLPERYALTTSVRPDNAGRINKNPDQEQFNSGESVQLNATANNGFNFDSWSGDLDNNDARDNPITITMGRDHSLVARFTEIPPVVFNLDVSVEPENGGSVIKNPDKQVYTAGETIQLTAEAAEGFQFEEWQDDIETTDALNNPLTLIMDDNKTITAHFNEIILHEIRVKKINLSAHQESGQIIVNARVLIWDEKNNRDIEGAQINILWTLPDSSKQEQTNTTDNNAETNFQISGGEGEYILEILNAIKPGYRYNTDVGETRDSITV